MSPDRETLAAYAARLDDYARMTDAQADDPGLAAFIAALPAGARVLDLGCGPGRAAARMAAAGLTVEATDAAPGMVEMAARTPGVTARLASFDDISGTDLYDGIWASFSLLHAPRADMPRHLAALRRALKPGGLFHVGMKTGTGERRDSLGRFYAYYTGDELHALLNAAGLLPVASRTGRDAGLEGAPEDWITITAHG
jgi:SAM-dependent methyltransferase